MKYSCSIVLEITCVIEARSHTASYLCVRAYPRIHIIRLIAILSHVPPLLYVGARISVAGIILICYAIYTHRYTHACAMMWNKTRAAAI